MWLRFDPSRDALFLDVDGTLLDIASSSNEVAIPDALVDHLGRLSFRLGGALALISGRMIHELDALFHPLRLCCSGVHGAEWRLSPDGPVETGGALPAALRDNIALFFRDMEGVFVEDKIYNVAIHYRQAPQKEKEIREDLARLVKRFAGEVRLLPGRKVIEVAPLTFNKGLALERFLKTDVFAGRRPVFLGDDTTDLSAMGACVKFGGQAARVGKGGRSGHAFASPRKVREWIGQQANGQG